VELEEGDTMVVRSACLRIEDAGGVPAG